MIQKSYKSFDYEFYGDFSKKQINGFMKTQQKDLNRILKFLKIKKINDKLKYKVFSTLQEKRDSDPNHSASPACARVGEKTIYRVLNSEMESYPEMKLFSFPHEIVHLLMHEISPSYNWKVTLDTYDGKELKKEVEFDSIVFLQEGTALLIDEIVFGNKLRRLDEHKYLDDWVKYNCDKHNIKISNLIEYHESSEQKPLYSTPICGSFCKYLYGEYGLEKFLKLYKSCSELDSKNKNIGKFKVVYDKSLSELENEWHRTLKTINN